MVLAGQALMFLPLAMNFAYRIDPPVPAKFQGNQFPLPEIGNHFDGFKQFLITHDRETSLLKHEYAESGCPEEVGAGLMGR